MEPETPPITFNVISTGNSDTLPDISIKRRRKSRSIKDSLDGSYLYSTPGGDLTSTPSAARTILHPGEEDSINIDSENSPTATGSHKKKKKKKHHKEIDVDEGSGKKKKYNKRSMSADLSQPVDVSGEILSDVTEDSGIAVHTPGIPKTPIDSTPQVSSSKKKKSKVKLKDLDDSMADFNTDSSHKKKHKKHKKSKVEEKT